MRFVTVIPLLLTACAAPPPPASEAGLLLWRGRSAVPVLFGEGAVDPFDRAVLSWNATGAVTAEIEADGRWHLVARPDGGVKSGEVDVDTLVLKSPVTRIRGRVTPEAGVQVTLAALTTWKSGARPPCGEVRSAAWGRVLDVPQRSQRVEERDPGEICSPTSVSMVLEFHGVKKPTAEVARGVYDAAQKIYGNWPLNTAYAHRASGMECFVVRSTLEAVEKEIDAGRPVVLSHKWKAGDLDDAPISASDGHLIVVVGFTETGDVVVNDPAAKPGEVRRTFKRRQLHATWQERASGVAYFFRPAR